jgi:hypothetical protein
MMLRLLAFCVCLAPLSAQPGLQGWVRSPDGAPVAEARIELRTAAGALLESVLSGDDGRFAFRQARRACVS